MMHTIPKEYTHDAKLITLYNTGFKDGFYNGQVCCPILDEHQILTDEERLCYANGRRAGELRKREESKNGTH